MPEADPSLAVTMQLGRSFREEMLADAGSERRFSIVFEVTVGGKIQLHCSWVFGHQVESDQELTRFKSA